MSDTKQTAVKLLLSKIPDASEIKSFISENDADEKMLDEWLWEKIYKGVDYIAMEREQIESAYSQAHEDGRESTLNDRNYDAFYYERIYGNK